MGTALESLPGLLDRPGEGEQRTSATGTDAFSVAPKVALDSVQLRNCQALSRVAGITVSASLDPQEPLSKKAFREVLTTSEEMSAVGLEPTTYGLKVGDPSPANATNQGDFDSPSIRLHHCLHQHDENVSAKRDEGGGRKARKSKPKTSVPIPATEPTTGFAAALLMIASLPLSDAEKAEAVRRLLTGTKP